MSTVGEICFECRNFFEKEKRYDTFVIQDNEITPLDFIQQDQYFRIIGSVFNDGIYLNTEEGRKPLKNEIFSGSIWAMAIPPAVIALSAEIDKWKEKYQDAVNTPYSSESFGGYSYSKASSGRSASGGSISSWKDVYFSELNKWRKI